MQRYFFHTQTDTRFTDAEGLVLDGRSSPPSDQDLRTDDDGCSRRVLGIASVERHRHQLLRAGPLGDTYGRSAVSGFCLSQSGAVLLDAASHHLIESSVGFNRLLVFRPSILA